MRIENEVEAKGVVRKYINGTRSRHGKIVSIVINEPVSPNEKGVWTIEGSYLTEEGDRSQFTASVTPRGEVVMTNHPPRENKESRRPSLVT